MKCPFCNQEMKDSANFCAKCGNAIPRCPTCGKVITKRTRFCTNDGTPLPEELVAMLPENVETPKPPATPVEVYQKTTVRPGQPQKKKKSTFVVVAVLAFLMIVAVSGVAGYAVMNGSISATISKIVPGFKESSQEKADAGKQDAGDTNADLVGKQNVQPVESRQNDVQTVLDETGMSGDTMSEDAESDSQLQEDIDSDVDLENTKGQSHLEEKEMKNRNELKEEPEQAMQDFGITSDAVEDYATVLNPDQYRHYDSGISDFSFSYPAKLYNDVSYDDQKKDEDYGENVETIRFDASGGSELCFSISKRVDGLSMEEMTNHIYENESASMVDSAKIIFSTEPDHGRVIVTGYSIDRSKLIYDMVKVEPDYVLHMKLTFPQYTGEKDKLQKGYVTECVYRMCGFSGSTDEPRSYEDYKGAQ